MMDLKEAISTLNSYAERLDVSCNQYEMLADWAEAEKKARNIETKVADLVYKACLEIKRLDKDALIFRILIAENLARETERVHSRPELTGMVDAQKQLDVISSRASTKA